MDMLLVVSGDGDVEIVQVAAHMGYHIARTPSRHEPVRASLEHNDSTHYDQISHIASSDAMP